MSTRISKRKKIFPPKFSDFDIFDDDIECDDSDKLSFIDSDGN